ncbi:DUF695 domain-containing protein [Elizabethkingia meningoseptica]|uniref:DUF695 domain-containing protein n=1 Tax=Elizabethkingia meningoseptica TaxID=238 RepID=UPI002DD64755|nr:DUF695 domain-containing protein [Elizabethkingia meningoseptica]MEC4711851.1 DUF695 domain-containing protein [Elizabethkingia meningoseptica]
MEWNEIKTDNQKIYPQNSITLFLMDTEAGIPGTCWVDKAYANYPYKQECMFNCYISVDLLDDEFNRRNKDLDYAGIEDYFTTQLRQVCVCHIIARITTDYGIAIELYVDDVERVIQKLNEIESDENRLVNFNCEICDDENWDNVASLLYEEE